MGYVSKLMPSGLLSRFDFWVKEMTDAHDAIIKKKLEAMERRWPRHQFKFSTGHNVTTVRINKPVDGLRSAEDLIHGMAYDRFDSVRALCDAADEIVSFSLEFQEEYFAIGAYDIETDAPRLPERKPKLVVF